MLAVVVVSLVRMVFKVQMVAVLLLVLLDLLDPKAVKVATDRLAVAVVKDLMDLLVVVDSRGNTFSQDLINRTDHLIETGEADANATAVGPVLGEVQSRVGKVFRVAQDSKVDQVIRKELTALAVVVDLVDQAAAEAAADQVVLVAAVAAVALAVLLVTMALAASVAS
tara:strand:+ start:68 stop:571 length:504 start_codon:yes stop_codon:yes gene_type:complete